ncbi:putative transcription factor [Corchorus capsularis]|uniref:Putative transcription factor n=1 Tax=Corchorus capsularis TaxID=210143 RepID=A0A1R3GRP2_COCAP|nr:putative transcription factor [Corchorus capsularis]
MSNHPPPPLPSTHHHHHHHHHQPPHITTTKATTQTPATATTSTTTSNREYRKGNWTIQETLTLITAKKLDDERRTKPSTSSPSKPGELRWKWVENYCWDHGCFRSQNQCNDKWDNLLRDYKKIRHYQSQILPQQQQQESSDQQQKQHLPSYWSMERHERKLHNLPTNMSPEVFEALSDVLQRRYNTQQQEQQQQQQPQQQQTSAGSIQQQQQQQQQKQLPTVSQSSEQLGVRRDQQAPEIEAPVTLSEDQSDSSETESSENQGSETKRKRVRKIGTSIMRSASVIAKTLKSCEEKKEKRHQEVMELEQRRLQLEETRNEVNRKGITDIVAAMTNLSGAIQSLIANHYDQT